MKEKPTVSSPLFLAFPSDHIPKAMMNVSLHFFIFFIYISLFTALCLGMTSKWTISWQSRISVFDTREFLESFETYTYVNTHTHTHTYIFVHADTYTHKHKHTCLHADTMRHC